MPIGTPLQVSTNLPTQECLNHSSSPEGMEFLAPVETLFMKTSLLSFLILALLTLGCQTDNRPETGSDNSNSTVNTEQETPRKLIDYLVGEWAIDSVAGPDQEGDNQRIVFTQEARYIVYAGQEKIDSGAYRMNEQLANLYLESELNEDAKEYEISFEGNLMRMKPNQTAGDSAGGAITYRKVGSETSPNQ